MSCSMATDAPHSDGATMRILLAIDDSEHSQQAVRMIPSRPWPGGSLIRIVSAVPRALPPPPAPAWTGATIGYSDFQERRRSQAESLVKGAADRLREAGLAVETAVRIGNPRSVIVAEAKEWSADLVIVGSRSRSGIWALGSVSRYVVGHVSCSIEIVRPDRDRNYRAAR
jgi:nucleotide-binding universal stress UspA family protein